MTLVLRRFALTCSFLVAALGYDAAANPNGVVGLLTQGCGCHSPAPGSQTLVSATSASGSFSVQPGGTLEITVTVAHASRSAAGVNIGIKNMPTGPSLSNAGTLTASPGLRRSSGELTHNTPKTMTNGSASFTFTWTAPNETGTYYLLAVGNAVNGNGGESGDTWAPLTPVSIVVGATSVAEETSISKAAAAPNPAHGRTVFEYTLDAPTFVGLEVVNALGQTVYAQAPAPQNAGTGAIPWNGMNSNGEKAAAGIYYAIVGSENNIRKIPFVLIH